MLVTVEVPVEIDSLVSHQAHPLSSNFTEINESIKARDNFIRFFKELDLKAYHDH